MCSSAASPHPRGCNDIASWDRNRKGNVAEAAVVLHAARLGVQVFRPLLEHGRYDLVLDVGGRLQRVQCKWARRVNDVVSVKIASSRLTPAGYVRTHYLEGEIDAVAAYCAELDRCYFLPADLVIGRTDVSLRLVEPRNGQSAGIHWAADHELSRAAGSAVDSDLPPSGHSARVKAAILRETVVEDVVVSAHEFRDRFGLDMQLAAAGSEIHVTRHGKPFVRLVAATRSDDRPGDVSP